MLHDQVEPFLCLNDLVELDNVRMPYYLEDMNLSCDSFYITDISNFPLLQNLDRHLLLSVHMHPLLYLPECTLSQCLNKPIVSNLILLNGSHSLPLTIY